LSGAAAARHILDAAGLQDVGIEQIGGQLSDHYDPQAKVLRLSSDVFRSHSAAAVGIAAHEAGHALQDAQNYGALVVRNAAVPLAGFGSNASLWMLMGGFLLGMPMLVKVGIIAFAFVVFFQLINLPVEFDASNRAKRLLVDYGIVGQAEYPYVRSVLNAAGWTYVAATLQAVLTLLYYIYRFSGSSDE
ncbi:MAG: zinc metallopeptidase, partial [Planctomycetales bacterium]|nr:zinc metallopeptidase [Planctomycetales bacterium]